jgi:hypothetical protein
MLFYLNQVNSYFESVNNSFIEDGKSGKSPTDSPSALTIETSAPFSRSKRTILYKGIKQKEDKHNKNTSFSHNTANIKGV